MANIYDLSDTWNDGATTFTSIKMDVTDTASAAASALLDLQVASTSVFKVAKAGGLVMSTDTYITRKAAGSLQLGAADAAAPVAQSLSVQNVVAGTTNTAGPNFNINGSIGTGSAYGGSIVFNTSYPGSAGTAQNTLTQAFAIHPGVNADTSSVVFGNPSNASGYVTISLGTRVNAITAFGTVYGAQPLNISMPGGVSMITDTAKLNFGTALDVVLGRDAAGIMSLRGSSATTGGALSMYTYGASPPSAPAAGIVRLYADTSGAKIRFMAVFPSGAAQQIAIEP